MFSSVKQWVGFGTPSPNTISADSDSWSLFLHKRFVLDSVLRSVLFFKTHFLVDPASVQMCRWVPFNVMNYRQRPHVLFTLCNLRARPNTNSLPPLHFWKHALNIIIRLQSGCSRHWRLFILTWTMRCFHWVIKEMKTSHKIEVGGNQIKVDN